MSKAKDPWLDQAQADRPKPKASTEELHATIALQQIELAQQKQIISLLLFQLSQVSTGNQPQTFDDVTASFARLGRDQAAQPLPENVIDLHEWLDRKYPF